MSLQILAGPQALAEIRENGLSPERIKLMVGASGGPKWLMLSRLDQYFAEHILGQAKQEISLIGSSIGSWRMACYSSSDPLQTFKEFEHLYLNQRYSAKLRPAEITEFVNVVLDKLFTGERAQFIADHPNRKLHVVAVRARRWLNGRSPLAQGFPLFLAAVGNMVSPRIVHALYPKVLISQNGSHAPYYKKPETIRLTRENLPQALSASGAIPIVMEPAKVQGGLDRWHWDGGIADYHFSGPFRSDDGLVFYPHFSPKIVPGWFDKALSWRQINDKNYSNVVMVVPSYEFIETLPNRKIPDRKDFEKLSDDERERAWKKVVESTNRLVDEFHDAYEKDQLRTKVQPLNSILK